MNARASHGRKDLMSNDLERLIVILAAGIAVAALLYAFTI